MVNAENRHAVSTRGTCNGNHSIKIQTAVEKGVSQVDRVGMQRRDQVRTRCEILRPTGMQEHLGENRKKQQSCVANTALFDLGQTVASRHSSEWRETTAAGNGLTVNCQLQ